MTPPILEQQRAHYAGEARGVVTNGIGKRTTAHLNLTTSIADKKLRDILSLPGARK